MALSTETINIDVTIPDDSEFSSVDLHFKLSEADSDAVSAITIPPRHTIVSLDASGQATTALWPVDRGIKGAYYTVTLYGVVTGESRVYKYELGRIQPLDGAGPYSLAELLQAGGAVASAAFYSVLTEAEYQAALDAVDAAAAYSPYANRPAAEAANVPAPALRIAMLHDGAVYSFIRDPGGTALTTGDGAKWSPDGQPFAGHWGALGDSATDNTTAIQAAIDWVSASLPTYDTYAELKFGPGIFFAGQLTQKDRVILTGAGMAATELRAIASLNDDFIISDGFDTLTGTNVWLDSEDVPSLIGLKDIRIHGNKASQTAGRGVCYYAKGLYFSDAVITDAYGDGLYTEAGENGAVGSWPTLPEGSTGHLTVMNCGGLGWLMRGPHDLYAKKVVLLTNGTGGFKAESLSSTYLATADFGMLHCYNNGTGKGVHLVRSAVRIGQLRSENHDAEGLYLEDADNCEIGQAHVFDNCQVSGDFQVVVDQNSRLNQLPNLKVRRMGRAACGGVQIMGQENVIGGVVSGDVTGGGWATGTGVEVEDRAQSNLIDFTITNMLGTGGVGLATNVAGAAEYNRITAVVRNCDTVWNNANAGIGNSVTLAGSCGVSATRFSGVGPANGANRELWDATIRADGSNYSLSEERIFGSFDLNSTTEQTVTYNHNLLTTPRAEDVQLQINYGGGLFTWEVAYARVVSVSSTQIVAKIKLITAAGSAGTGTLWCHARL